MSEAEKDYRQEERRLVKVPISKELILALCKPQEGLRIDVVEGIPQDADYVDVYEDCSMDCLFLIIKHPSFEVVELGSVIPNFYSVALRQVDLRPPLEIEKENLENSS